MAIVEIATCVVPGHSSAASLDSMAHDLRRRKLRSPLTRRNSHNRWILRSYYGHPVFGRHEPNDIAILDRVTRSHLAGVLDQVVGPAGSSWTASFTALRDLFAATGYFTALAT